MEIIISHKSALEYWRLHRKTKIEDSARQRRKSLPASLPGTTVIRDTAPSGLSYPINLMVGSPEARRKSTTARSHIYSAPIPDWCFIGIGDGVSVSAPAFCFFQMAGELPLPKLVELGLELCGTYSLPANSGHTYDNSKEPAAALEDFFNHPLLTSVNELRAHARRMKGASGQKKVRRALRYIADGSASPMETILFMLLTLPKKLGGYGLPQPKLNRRIDPGKAGGQRFGKDYYVCDLFWPEAKLAVEYDSDTYHTGADRIAGDTKKRLDLAADGIDVVTVTKRQVRDAAELESLAGLIARKLGKRLRSENPAFQKAKRELRKLLL